MRVGARPQMSGSAYATRRVTKPPNWHGLVAWDMFFNNLTTGLFLVAALGELTAPGVFGPTARAAYPIALILLVADLLCLVLDLGDPMRFHHMLRVFKPGSPMSLGTWCLTIYWLPLTLIVASDLLSRGWAVRGWIRWPAVVGGLLPAFGSAVYKGVLFSTTAQPGWRDARWLGGYLANSAIMLGCAEMLVLATVMGQDRAAVVLRPALGLLLVLNLIPLGLLIVEFRPTISAVEARGRLVGTGAVALGVGLLIPLVLLLAGSGLLPVLAAVFGIFLGSWLIRSAIVQLPQESPTGPRA